MKVKLKRGEKLSSNQNYCGLIHDDWIALNQGKEVNLDSVPSLIKNKIETHSKTNKGDK
tara:strand:- start:315 stop:491 length:177 start_codon:yes stop_codon:yes gene_type:complete